MDSWITWVWIEGLHLTVFQILLKPKQMSLPLSMPFTVSPSENSYAAQPVSHTGYLSLLWALVTLPGRSTIPSVLLFLPVTVRIFTCYFPSPPLSGTKSGHWPPWFFSLVTRSFYLLNSSLCITPAKSPLVEPTSCQIDPVFLTFPKRHRPIMNMLWHLPPFCFPIQSVPLWSPFLHSSFSWNQYIPNSLSQKNQKKNFAMGLTRK